MQGVAFPELLERRADLAGGFVVIDPDGWHEESITAVASRAAESGARLVIYSALTAALCRHVAVVAAVTASEVVLSNTDDSGAVLRETLRRHVASVPALVLAGLSGNLMRTSDSLGAHVTSYLSWAPIPATVQRFSDVVGLSRRAMLARLHACGLGDTVTVPEVTRAARACHHLLDDLPVPVAARLACFGSERAMRGAFERRLAATPSEVRGGRQVTAVADTLITAATRASD